MELDIYIDSLTNCLIDSETDKERDTEYRLIAKTISLQDAKILCQNGWQFDWSIPHQNNYEVYELLLKGDDEAQGMIALKHYREQLYTHVDIVESAPWNIGSNGRYKGVGAHLFAIACKLSWNVGNEGYVQFTAKTALVDHYRETLGAQSIDAQNMYLDSYAAVALIQRYFKEV